MCKNREDNDAMYTPAMTTGNSLVSGLHYIMQGKRFVDRPPAVGILYNSVRAWPGRATIRTRVYDVGGTFCVTFANSIKSSVLKIIAKGECERAKRHHFRYRFRQWQTTLAARARNRFRHADFATESNFLVFILISMYCNMKSRWSKMPGVNRRH